MFFETDEQRMEEFIKLSHIGGSRADYVQGGGGNTSVKLSDGLMAIKASGFCLSDITPNKAYAVLDGAAVRRGAAGGAQQMDEHPFQIQPDDLLGGKGGLRTALQQLGVGIVQRGEKGALRFRDDGGHAVALHIARGQHPVFKKAHGGAVAFKADDHQIGRNLAVGPQAMKFPRLVKDDLPFFRL